MSDTSTGERILADLFPPVKRKEISIPAAFSTRCRTCGTEMERLHPVYCTTHKPYATFRCTTCSNRLYLFNTEVGSVTVSHKRMRDVGGFSKAIEIQIAKHRRTQ